MTNVQLETLTKKFELVEKMWRLLVAVVFLAISAVCWGLKMQFDVINLDSKVTVLALQIQSIKDDRENSRKEWQSWRESVIRDLQKNSTNVDNINSKLDRIIIQKGIE